MGTRIKKPRDPRPTRTRKPNAVALDTAVKLAAALVLRDERVKVGQQRHAARLSRGARDGMCRIRYAGPGEDLCQAEPRGPRLHFRILPHPQVVRDASSIARESRAVLFDEEWHPCRPALFDGIGEPCQVHHLTLIVGTTRASHHEPIEFFREVGTPVDRAEHGLVTDPPHRRPRPHEMPKPLVLGARDARAGPHVPWQLVAA